MKKRLSTPRAATVIVLAAVVALSVTVAPSIAASFLTPQAASKKFVTNKKAAKTYVTKAQANAKAADYLTKKAAANTYVAKKTAPLSPVVGIAAGTTVFSANASTAGYIPTAFTSFATKADASSAVITFSGMASCTNGSTTKAPTPDQSCPVQILVDGQSTGKVSFAPATLEGTTAKPAAALVHTISQTTVLGKGGHVITVQYAGASGLNFQLKGWNLSVQAYPQPEEPEEETTTPKKSSGGKS
ncbi:MAG TPA: hypothetical protein VN522_09640 [Solirubrobacterales bacterium]|nr:hypothetical protein [Solirubrobacterales bacterium]